MGHNENSAKKKSIVLSAWIKKMERSYTNTLTAQLRALEQKEANSPKRSRRQERLKVRVEINQIETKRTIERISKTKNWFFERFKKIAKLTKWPRGSIQIIKIRNENGDIKQKRRKFKKNHQIPLQKPILNKTEKSR